MAGLKWILLLPVLTALACSVRGSQQSSRPSSSHNTADGCSGAEIYLKQDWDKLTSCCRTLYPNQTCPIACPCRNGAECLPSNRTCLCKPGWVGPQCQRSCRDIDNHTYGPDCNRNCRCGPDATCEPITGACECVRPDNCTSRCPRNRYGPKCRQKCRCKTGECDQITGACMVTEGSPSSCGCLNGGSCRSPGKPCRCPAAWSGRQCDEPCPPGYYGDHCSIQCECGDNSTCSRTTGLCECSTGNKYSCPGRCLEGLYGPRCSNECRCPVGLACNHWTGDCECRAGNCMNNLIVTTTADVTTPLTTQSTPPKTDAAGSGNPPPPDSATTTPPAIHTEQESTAIIPKSTAGSTTGRAGEGSDGRPAATGPETGPGPVADGSPQRSDDDSVKPAGNGFYPSAPFWGVVGAITTLLVVVVVLLLLILRRQVSSSRLALTRQPKIGRQDNVYETVEELGKGKGAATEQVKTPPPLPDMFQRGGSTRSSVHSYHHRPLSVHSPLPTMDAPLPASVAAMVCNDSGGPPVPGGTSRRSLMAEWRPHGHHQDSSVERTHRSHLPDRSGKALSCIYNGGITIEDDYADPFDTIVPTGTTGNRPAGYLPMILGQEQRRSQSSGPRSSTPTNIPRGNSPVTVPRSDSPLGQRCGSPMAIQRCESPVAVPPRDSPMTVQRCESPRSPQRSSSLMNVQHRTASPLTVHQSEPNLHLHQTDSNMNFHRSNSPRSNSPLDLRKGGIPGSSSNSPQRQSASLNVDPFYFTLEQGVTPDSPKGPDDDYDELEPQSPINSPAVGFPFDNRCASSRTNSERSRGSSRGSLSTTSPTLGSSFGSSPRDAEMVTVSLDRRPDLHARPELPQRPVSSNVYQSCGPPKKFSPPEDDGVYSRLNRTPSQRMMEIPTAPRGVEDLDTSTYGRLQRSYSAKMSPRNSTEGPYGKLPQRSRSAMVKSQQHISGSAPAECVAGEWVPAEPHPRLPPRGTKPPNVTEPRKKSRWSIKGKRSKKPTAEEMDLDCSSTATLPYPGDWKP